MKNTTQPSHRLGANRKETTHKPRQPRRPSESCDVREDRGARQSKFAHPEHTVTLPTGKGLRLLPGRTRPPLLSEHAGPGRPGTARLQFKAEGVASVCIAGSFNGWLPQDLRPHQTNPGAWEIELTLPPGQYEYRFLADGCWVDDPHAEETVANPFGTCNAVLRVRG